MVTRRRFTITAALPYANGPLHIGHIAGAYLSSDIYARFRRLQGHDVFFVCGSDEHGAAITMRAKKEGRSPQDIIDTFHLRNTKAFEAIGISFDIFHRTSSELHHKEAQAWFKAFYENDVFSVKTTEQLYDVTYKQFLADRYVKGTCPKCAYEEAYGDQCESCGSSLSPNELINPKSTLSGSKPELRQTSHWYLPLDKESEWLNTWLNSGMCEGSSLHDVKAWKKHVLGACNSWLDEGLQPRAITRDLDWGVDVPSDIEGSEGKKLYVWLDAPIGYVSATKAAEAQGIIGDWKPYWQDEDTELLHFIGKDNIVFHCIIFPAMLRHREGYILPKNVPANEFLNLEGRKISTSRDWAVWVDTFLENNPSHVDALRYVLAANMPETKDAEFTWDDYQARVNNELVATIGNYVNRVLQLFHRFNEGRLGETKSYAVEYKTAMQDIKTAIEAFRFRDALQGMLQLARTGDKFLADNEPWKCFKTDPIEAQAMLNASMQQVARLAGVMQIFLPHAANRLLEMINWSSPDWTALASKDNLLDFDHTISTFGLLFEKIDNSWIADQKQQLQNTLKSNPNAMPQKDEITFDAFQTMDLRVGKILNASRVPKTDKLMQMQVDVGFETRTLVSGIAEHFSEEELPGQMVQVLANLAPRKIRGVESKGMILLSETSEGKLYFVKPSVDATPGDIVS